MHQTLLADRFLRRHDTWFDIATAGAVGICLKPAGPLRQQIAWAERCAMLGRLRHPALNPLVDYGAADNSTFFEAYGLGPPLAGSRASASRMVTHAARFLDAHGVDVPAAAAPHLFRRFATASVRAGPPLGILLQPRRAAEALMDFIRDPLHGGVTAAAVSGPPGSGLQTITTEVARVARSEGFVAVCAAALMRWPELLDEVDRRHVCLLLPDRAGREERAAAARLLARLAARSARSHRCLRFTRGERAAAGTLQLDRMGMTSMTSMLYIDPDYGPAADDIFAAARQSDGLPGRLLAALGARFYDAPHRSVFVVHEVSPVYGIGDVSGQSTDRLSGRSRIGSILWRARNRAAVLQTRGRHAAAGRLLERAARALEGRGEPAEAARCWRERAWTARQRGAIRLAIEHATRAASSDPSAEGQIAAACLTAICWTDEGRFIEAEASLRNLVAAAKTLGDDTLHARCLLALARVRLWNGHPGEVQAATEVVAECRVDSMAAEARVLRARAELRAGRIPSALHAARDALARAVACRDARLIAAAHQAAADVLREAGDVEGVRLQVEAGLRAARSAQLPLRAMKLRAVLLGALRDADAPESVRLRAALERALRRGLPMLVRRSIETAMAIEPRLAVPDSTGVHLEHFLDIAQRAADDRRVVADILAALCERLGAASTAVVSGPDARIVVSAGRPWRDRPLVAAQAAASGVAVPPDKGRQPPEAGEPVRCGGELIAAIGCRWVLGMDPGHSATAILRAAGMAMATHVRSLLESPDPPPPTSWGDLLGESTLADDLREAIRKASRAPFPVLIEGESGSGKELVARAIHKLSARHARRFCAINCAALSDELVEAELFGHTRGAFTGAAAERAGLFEEADGGTLFLDEIGELSTRAQAKLLRVLQEGEVRRVGENMPRRVDVRIVAATNRRLEQEAAGGRFRADLRYRLDVLRIAVPPLRDRIGDIPILARHFWQQACARVGSQATLGAETLAALSRYDWPGNVRELQNAIAWLAVHAPRRGRVSTAMLPAQLASSPFATGSFEAAREEFERRFVRTALAQAGGHRLAAARALGVSRQGLAKMLRRLGIDDGGDAGGTA